MLVSSSTGAKVRGPWACDDTVAQRTAASGASARLRIGRSLNFFRSSTASTLVSYYEVEGQELDKALQIFIRMNDGGTPLSHSDLAAFNCGSAVHRIMTPDRRFMIWSMNSTALARGFTFSKDLLLKAGLMLSDIGSVGFKVDNFNRKNMATLESKWERDQSGLSC